MQPLINLKQFLAVLLLIVIPAVLITAYFRDYDPVAGGHPHGGGGDHHARGGQAAETKKTGHEHGAAEKPEQTEEDYAKMSHTNKPQSQGSAAPSQQEQQSTDRQTPEQLEASRLQLEASRAQLEASRKALEAAKPADDKQPQHDHTAPTQPQPQQPPASPAAKQEPKAGDGHAHKH